MKKRIILGATALAVFCIVELALRSDVDASSEKQITSEKLPVVSVHVLKEKQKNLVTLDGSKYTQIFILGEISNNVPSIVKAIKDASNNKKRTLLLINSPGGSVVGGARIITAMQASHTPVDTVCTDLCASMAALITEYGAKRYAVDRATLMFHAQAMSGTFDGEVDKIVKRVTYAKTFFDKMIAYVSKRVGVSFDQLKSLSSQELWIDSEDALDLNYIDSVVKIDHELEPDILDALILNNSHKDWSANDPVETRFLKTAR